MPASAAAAAAPSPSAAAAAPTLKLFVGSSARSGVEEAVFLRSLALLQPARPLAVFVLEGDRGTVRHPDGRREPLPDMAPRQAKGVTPFSLARFAIPELCGYQGRALYCDSDQLARADPTQLLDFALGDAAVAAVPLEAALTAEPYRQRVLDPLRAKGEDYFLTSVLLLDCARTRWSVAELRAGLDDGRYDYTGLMYLGRSVRATLGLEVAALPPTWNCLDANPPDAKILHFTDLKSQPWRFPHNPIRAVWEAAFFEALEAGAVAPETVRTARRLGGLDRRTAWVAAAPAGLRRRLHATWTALKRPPAARR